MEKEEEEAAAATEDMQVELSLVWSVHFWSCLLVQFNSVRFGLVQSSSGGGMKFDGRTRVKANTYTYTNTNTA